MGFLLLEHFSWTAFERFFFDLHCCREVVDKTWHQRTLHRDGRSGAQQACRQQFWMYSRQGYGISSVLLEYGLHSTECFRRRPWLLIRARSSQHNV